MPDGWAQFRAWLLERRHEIVAVIRARRTQTNEPARCATLLPLLATLPQPLALLEVGAPRVCACCPIATRTTTTAITCRRRNRPAPRRRHSRVVRAPRRRCPRAAWTSSGAPAWTSSRSTSAIPSRPLGWRRSSGLARATGSRSCAPRSRSRREDPPPLVRGDLRHDLAALAAGAPADATLVIFHTAVLAYVPDPADRAAFARTIGGLDAVWIANEAPGLLEGAERPAHPWPAGFDPFMLSLDKRPIAWTDPHGTRIDWIAA